MELHKIKNKMNEPVIQDFIMYVVSSQIVKTAYISLFQADVFFQFNKVFEYSSSFSDFPEDFLPIPMKRYSLGTIQRDSSLSNL